VPLVLRVAGTEWQGLADGVTDADGRYRFSDRGGSDQLPAGTYRVEFDTGSYFSASGQVGFYPEVSVTFEITDPAAHHHVPLLLSPFAYSTYRGS
jgi:5-hydroxyisourate hydrolase